jgi:predicted glycosyltransferase
MTKSLSVLICPLDWGIGHATRCVPVIRHFLEQHFRVIIAADGKGLEFLKLEFPGCRCIRFPGTTVNYSAGKRFSLKMLFLSPSLLTGIFMEHHQLKKIILSERPDIIFSDNRYGLWNKACECIFMTHQLKVIPPRGFGIFSGIVNGILWFFIRKFDECWVPDEAGGENLAGKLSHANISFPVSYIGLLSRFDTRNASDDNEEMKFDFLALLSGPEPQRTTFGKILLAQITGSSLRGLVVQGSPGEDTVYQLTENIQVISHLDTAKLKVAMIASKVIICRPGYSTLMDLAALGKNAILVPTPGQTEQEYLAERLTEKDLFFSVTQEHFQLDEALEKSQGFPGIKIHADNGVMKERIKEIVLRRSRLLPGENSL